MILFRFCSCHICDTTNPLLETLEILGWHVNRDGFAVKADHKETAHIHALCKGCTLQNTISASAIHQQPPPMGVTYHGEGLGNIGGTLETLKLDQCLGGVGLFRRSARTVFPSRKIF